MSPNLLQEQVVNAANSWREVFNASLPPHEQEVFRPVLELFLSDPTIPASSSKSSHGGFDGGLIVHSWYVFQLLNKLVGAPLSLAESAFPLGEPLIQDPDSFPLELSGLGTASCFKVAMMHDLNKVRTLEGKPYYAPNMIKGGTVRSEAKPWEVNKDRPAISLLGKIAREASAAAGSTVIPEWSQIFSDDLGISVRDGVLSLAVAAQVSPRVLSHLSPAEIFAIVYHDGAYAGRTGLTDKESMLQICLHAADMLASRFFC